MSDRCHGRNIICSGPIITLISGDPDPDVAPNRLSFLRSDWSNRSEFAFHATRTNDGPDRSYANRDRAALALDASRAPLALRVSRALRAPRVPSTDADCTHSSAAPAHI